MGCDPHQFKTLGRPAFFADEKALEFNLKSRLDWAYYPARMFRGGSSESVGSHWVAQGSVLHYGRDERSSGRAISARETGPLGRRHECKRKACRSDLAQ